MIIYFADRQLNILGQASTELPEGLTVISDTKTEEVENGVNIFECFIPFKESTRLEAERYTEVGNYLLRSADGKNEFYTIIEAEIDTQRQEIYVYAEDAGMDLINEVFGEFEADKAYSIDYYINLFAGDSGFKIGINEAKGLTRKLKWDGEATATERIASTATQFDGCEISYTFDIEGLTVTNKYINIHKQRGKDLGIQLRLNKEVSRIVTTKSIANLATALQCEGGVPEDKEEPITLKGYKYDDGDFYVNGSVLYSRKALERWKRYLWINDDTKQTGGHIVKLFDYDTTSQATLCAHAITELKKIRDMEVNYEIEVTELPENVKIGDRVNIIDDVGELYLSSRILKLQKSVADQKVTATLGEYLLKTSGISEKVEQLAADFAKNTVSVQRAASIANNAVELATNAQAQAEAAAVEVAQATEKAEEAKTAAGTATQAANNAEAQAKAAEAAVNKVEESVSSLEETVSNAKNAADNAKNAADTAEAKAKEAKTAAENAQVKAETAETAAGNAQTAAENAIANAATAKSTADTAKAQAEEANNTAQAAKLDAEQAEKDIATFAENLETVDRTMKAEYARKTDLTEAKADLQTQIKQNAAELSSTASKVQVIDETANDAAIKAQAAYYSAQQAQAEADKAAEDAAAAQAEADTAIAAAEAAQAEADIAQAAYETAKSVADNAEAALNAAIADLETVQSRADATETEIAEAQAAVNSAQATANTAKVNAETARATAETAQTAANSAVETATQAQINAHYAAQQAENARKAVDIVNQSAASEAIEKAAEAKNTAEEAQNTANTAKTNAETAKATADKAVEDAIAAENAAKEAAQNVANAQADLETAKRNLANILAKADATDEEIAEAQAALETAKNAVNEAMQSAAAANSAAELAAELAAVAQAQADEAQTAATNAQTAADEAKTAADKAQADVNALETRVTTAETSITQNAEKIALRATKEEVTENSQTLAESLINQVADMIRMSVTDSHGQTVMKQTAEGWTFDISSLQDAVNKLTENVKIGTYTYIDENGVEQTEPAIDLCETDTGFKLKITNTRILFTDGNNNLVWIDSKEKALNTQKVKAEEVQLGSWVWQARNNGRNIGLVWKGAVN